VTLLPPSSRAWSYSRDSGGEDQDIGDQNRYIEQYCREHDLILERMFCDEAAPGSSTATWRPTQRVSMRRFATRNTTSLRQITPSSTYSTSLNATGPTLPASALSSMSVTRTVWSAARAHCYCARSGRGCASTQ